MSWENILKKDIYEGDPAGDRFNNESARKTYDWFMAVMSGKKHPKGDVHDNNLMYIFMNHVMRAFESDKGSREYQIAERIRETSLERGELENELYELLNSRIATKDRQIE